MHLHQNEKPIPTTGPYPVASQVKRLVPLPVV
jgi:hypothetical protein